jgi:methanogenic corrinoid protein MtbC1
MTILDDISAALQKGKAKDVQALVQQAIDQGLGARSILEDGLLSGMNIIGGKFKLNEVYVPEVLIAARAMNAGTALLKPLLASAGVVASGKVIIGTVKGDLHDIGKNLVRMMMEGKGLEVIDLGVDVSAEQFVQAVGEHQADILALSALLTTTMNEMQVVVDAINAAGLRDKVKIMIGGAPITESFRLSIGADAFTADAASASEGAIDLIERKAA